MRSGELCALHWEDVEANYIRIHRQQLLDNSVKGQRRSYEVQYTKDERKRPHGGRRFPITLQIKEILILAKGLEGDSLYIFHEADGEWIKKDGYEHYLSKRCHALGIKTTNNHAFIMALNSLLILQGFSSAGRALLLGHSVETNERLSGNKQCSRRESNPYLALRSMVYHFVNCSYHIFPYCFFANCAAWRQVNLHKIP